MGRLVLGTARKTPRARLYRAVWTGRPQVTIADLPMLSRRSFPLCMANQHAKFSETHHLKNDARNQFGLFLKGIGLSYEESYAYWRSEFTKVMAAQHASRGTPCFQAALHA